MLGILRRAGTQVNDEKLSFFAPEMNYLGYMLTKDDNKTSIEENPNGTGLTANNYSETIETFPGYDIILQRYVEENEPQTGSINTFSRNW